jgi:hypothetical protein
MTWADAAAAFRRIAAQAVTTRREIMAIASGETIGGMRFTL